MMVAITLGGRGDSAYLPFDPSFEPKKGLEPPTPSLQVRSSTIELLRHFEHYTSLELAFPVYHTGVLPTELKVHFVEIPGFEPELRGYKPRVLTS